MAGLQYNFFPTDLLYPKHSSSSSSSEAMNRASVTFKTDHGEDPKSLILQKPDRSPLILKHQIKKNLQLSKDSTLE